MADIPIEQIPGVGRFPMEQVDETPSAAPAPATPAAAATPAPASASWGLMDILALPEPPKSEPATETFPIHGLNRSITLSVDTRGAVDPDRMFHLTQVFTSPDNFKPLEIHCDTQKYTLRTPSYVASLRLLAEVTLSPPFSLDEWAEFGRRISPVDPHLMDKLFVFALRANKVGQQEMEEEERAAGESTGAAV